MKAPTPPLAGEAPAAPATVTGVALRPADKGLPLSPAQQRFNRLLARIGKLKGQLTDLQALALLYRQLYDSTLQPMRKQQLTLMREMALLLDERLQTKGLGQAQKRGATDILCELCETLAASGDKAMGVLHDKRSPLSLAAKAEAVAAEMRAMMEAALGQALDDADAPAESLDDVMRVGMAQLNEADLARQADYAARQAQRPPTAAQRKAAQQREDANTLLRKIFRQLASALHPDRERDPAEHLRKTALMSQANAAYARQDLLALLEIQLGIEQTDPQALARLPEEKLASMSLLLKQQASELEHELYGRRNALAQEFDLPPHQTPSATKLRAGLQQQQAQLLDEMMAMEDDLWAVRDEASFKRWLKVQMRAATGPVYFEL